MNGKDIFKELFKEQVDIFVNSFNASSKKIFSNLENKNNLHHAGEFGKYREKVVSKFLTLFTPQRLEIDSGFILHPTKPLSKQLDIVVYGKNETPLIKSEEGQVFFPIESIASVGEVKSNLDKNTLKAELHNLVEIKKLRESLGQRHRIYSTIPKFINLKDPCEESYFMTHEVGTNPKYNTSDQISTFIICNKFSFEINPENIHEQINSLYSSETQERHKVDFILSIENGFIGYWCNEKKMFGISPGLIEIEPQSDIVLQMITAKQKYNHFKQFVNQYYHALTMTSVFKPEISAYLRD